MRKIEIPLPHYPKVYEETHIILKPSESYSPEESRQGFYDALDNLASAIPHIIVNEHSSNTRYIDSQEYSEEDIQKMTKHAHSLLSILPHAVIRRLLQKSDLKGLSKILDEE